MKSTIIYVFDGLCSWCYGFDLQLQILKDRLVDTYDYQYVSGGMILEPNVKVSDILGGKDYRAGYAIVSETTGVQFSEKYLGGLLGDPDLVVGSTKPAYALSAFKTYANYPKAGLDFITTMQHNLFEEGMNPNDDAMYKAAALLFDINPDEFVQKMATEAVQQDANNDFQYARALQVNGYPQLFLKTSEEQYYVIAKGYSKADNIETILNQITAQRAADKS